MVDIPAEAVDAAEEAVRVVRGAAGPCGHIPSRTMAHRVTEAAAPFIAEQARREERARIVAHIRAIPEDDEPFRTAARKFIDRHPRLVQGTSLVAVLLAVADEIEGDDQ
ncbi:hypothetical protein [Streptosporangium roseum]|uniref:hypothetical protein n=1 Tax=Streptosporangium roseum TaxID=2001 RepID=UPI0033216ED5